MMCTWGHPVGHFPSDEWDKASHLQNVVNSANQTLGLTVEQMRCTHRNARRNHCIRARAPVRLGLVACCVTHYHDASTAYELFFGSCRPLSWHCLNDSKDFARKEITLYFKHAFKAASANGVCWALHAIEQSRSKNICIFLALSPSLPDV
eukprot:3974168-Pleurochrysis_carterae.AAC.1